MPADAVRASHRPVDARLHRRLFHLTAGSAFPTLYIFVDKELVLLGAIALACAAIFLEIVRRRSDRFNQIFLTRFSALTKASESRAVLGSTWMLIATTVCIGFMDRPIAIMALYYLSLGDPAAAIVGERFGRVHVGGKSLEGSAAFLAVSTAIGSLLVATTFETRYPVMIVGAVSAMLAEVAPKPSVDDNLKTPLIAGSFMELATALLG